MEEDERINGLWAEGWVEGYNQIKPNCVSGNAFSRHHCSPISLVFVLTMATLVLMTSRFMSFAEYNLPNARPL